MSIEVKRTFSRSKLENVLEKLGDSAESVSFPRQSISVFGCSIEDSNDVHRDRDVAWRAGFKRVIQHDDGTTSEIRDTPLIGVQLLAYGEKVVRGYLAKLREELGRAKLYNGEIIPGAWKRITFHHPAFPSDEPAARAGAQPLDFEITYRITPKSKANKLISLQLNAETQGREQRLFNTNIELFSSFDEVRQAHPVEIPDNPNWLFRRCFILDEQKISQFKRGSMYRNLHGNSVPFSLPIGYCTSTLLEFLRERTGKREGVNRSMDFYQLGEIVPYRGIEVLLLPTSSLARKIGETFLYKDVPLVIYQFTHNGWECFHDRNAEKSLVGVGTITCLSPYEIDTTNSSKTT
ncbi:hypothetical protein D6817_00680 [Candidatus Pacearchaeota archaeon]|nr:MAG: hypothetical protein D6817_00680 [Candidatus Pacearchaeota archaeon]